MFRTLPKGLRAPPDRAPALTAKAAGWLALRRHARPFFMPAREDRPCLITEASDHMKPDGAIGTLSGKLAQRLGIGRRRAAAHRPTTASPAASRHAARRRFRPRRSRSAAIGRCWAARRLLAGRPHVAPRRRPRPRPSCQAELASGCRRNASPQPILRESRTERRRESRVAGQCRSKALVARGVRLRASCIEQSV